MSDKQTKLLKDLHTFVCLRQGIAVPDVPQPLNHSRTLARQKHLVEEAKELLDADSWDRAIDALGDSMAVAAHALIEMGLNPFVVLQEIASANLRRERVTLPIEERKRPNDLYDVIKPEGWQPPNFDHAVAEGLSALNADDCITIRLEVDASHAEKVVESLTANKVHTEPQQSLLSPKAFGNIDKARAALMGVLVMFVDSAGKDPEDVAVFAGPIAAAMGNMAHSAGLIDDPATLAISASKVREAKDADYNQNAVKFMEYWPFGRTSFAQMLIIKALRIVSVLSKQSGEVNFESVQDSMVDFINYSYYLSTAIANKEI